MGSGWGVTWWWQQFHKDFSKASWLLPAICPRGMPVLGSHTSVTAGNGLIRNDTDGVLPGILSAIRVSRAGAQGWLGSSRPAPESTFESSEGSTTLPPGPASILCHQGPSGAEPR